MMDKFDTKRDISVSSHSISTFTDESSRAGLATLWRAYACASDAGAEVWDFALEIDQLQASGSTISELRWLVAKGYAEHGRETSEYGDPHRSFEKSPGLNFDPETCLVLTRSGADFVGQLLEDLSKCLLTPPPTPAFETDDPPPPTKGNNGNNGNNEKKQPASAARKPNWISGRRELWFGDQLVKRFRVPARNQEWILEVFEEDEWPECIDDPLPPSPDIDPKSRLHDAINRLNHKQTNPILRFHGNGNGQGVYWEVL